MKRRAPITAGDGRETRLKKRGFTLLEIAIVIGVIGAIIAAIFGAASLANRRVNVNEGADEVNMIAGNALSLYMANSPSFAALNATRVLNVTPTAADFCFYTTSAVQQGVFPIEMLSPQPLPDTPPAAGTVANHPWSNVAAVLGCGGSAQIALARATKAGAAINSAQLVVHYVKIPQDVCADLLVRDSLPQGGNGGVRRIIVTGGTGGTFDASTTPPTLPLSPLAAATACTGTETYTIDWYYNLSG